MVPSMSGRKPVGHSARTVRSSLPRRKKPADWLARREKPPNAYSSTGPAGDDALKKPTASRVTASPWRWLSGPVSLVKNVCADTSANVCGRGSPSVRLVKSRKRYSAPAWKKRFGAVARPPSSATCTVPPSLAERLGVATAVPLSTCALLTAWPPYVVWVRPAVAVTSPPSPDLSTMLMTPAIASEPYCADAPSRSTSMRSIIDAGMALRSTALWPRPIEPLTFTSELVWRRLPLTSTSTWSAPRPRSVSGRTASVPSLIVARGKFTLGASCWRICAVSTRPGAADLGRREHVDRDRRFDRRARLRARADHRHRLERRRGAREPEVARHGLPRRDDHGVAREGVADEPGAQLVAAGAERDAVRAVGAGQGPRRRPRGRHAHADERVAVLARDPAGDHARGGRLRAGRARGEGAGRDGARRERPEGRARDARGNGQGHAGHRGSGAGDVTCAARARRTT
jgi:hypothetical protein